jgi:hypothetical protein
MKTNESKNHSIIVLTLNHCYFKLAFIKILIPLKTNIVIMKMSQNFSILGAMLCQCKTNDHLRMRTSAARHTVENKRRRQSALRSFSRSGKDGPPFFHGRRLIFSPS